MNPLVPSLTTPLRSTPEETHQQVLRDDAKKAATQLEGHFLSYMLAQMHGETGAMGKGVGASTYQSMMDEHMGDAIAQSSPLGLRDLITQAMLGAEPKRTQTKAAEKFVGMRLSSDYGVRKHPLSGESAFHHGVDLATAVGTAVHAPRAGTVVFSGEQKGYGQMIELEHDDGSHTRYAHLSARDRQIGNTIAAGQPIGRTGDSGDSTGPHLHFEVRQDGQSIDPKQWLASDLTKSGLTSTVGVGAKLR